MLTVISSSWAGTIGLLIAAAAVVAFAGYLLWELSGRIEKVHWNAVKIKFRRR